MQARKTLLFNENKPWIKRNGDEDFDVPMGCFDGAEVCQLVGTYVLQKLSNTINKKDIGLYRDDGLGILRNIPGPQVEKIRKTIIQQFKECNLAITIQTKLFVVNFLDVQLSLKNMSCKPYGKPNNDPVYINKDSNHPPSVLKQVPISIGKRIS